MKRCSAKHNWCHFGENCLISKLLCSLCLNKAGTSFVKSWAENHRNFNFLPVSLHGHHLSVHCDHVARCFYTSNLEHTFLSGKKHQKVANSCSWKCSNHFLDHQNEACGEEHTLLGALVLLSNFAQKWTLNVQERFELRCHCPKIFCFSKCF